MSQDPQTPKPAHRARRYVINGIVIFVALILIALLLLPFPGTSRERSNRAVCAANLRGFGQSMVVYAGDNNEFYPYMGPATISAQPPTGNIGGGLMHDMFALVGYGQVAPKQFLCRSDPANTSVSLIPTLRPGIPAYLPEYWTNPTSSAPGAADLCYSYSFAYQYSISNGKTVIASFWRNTVDGGCPIGADMNPGANLLPGKTLYNSLNHQGDGQNVPYADAHVEFVRTPCVGAAGDNIYNIGSAINGPGTSGNPARPTGPAASGSFDIDLSPMILNTTDYQRK